MSISIIHARPIAMRFGAMRMDRLTPFLGAILTVRVLTDDRSAPDSRYSGSLNLSGVIAVLLIVVAIGLLIRRRRTVLPTALAVLWLCIWTLIAVFTRGASTETLREGVREGSIVALAVIVYNGRTSVSDVNAARIVQIAGVAPALAALYQLATHTGMVVASHVRAHGTLAHPNSAAMFFSIAAAASLWLYLDHGRRGVNALLVVLFIAALIATFSIDGLLTLVLMLIALGVLRPAAFKAKIIPFALAVLVILVFFATPLGSQRIASESSTSLAAANSEEPTSTFDWRLHKWKTLIPEWEHHPVFGQGLGTTTNTEGPSLNEFTGALPHNEYARYLVETGVLGLTILLCALAILIRSLLRGRRRDLLAQDGDAANASTLGIVVIVGCLVNSLADNTLLNSPTGYAAALIVIAVLSSPRAKVTRAQPSRSACSL